MDFNHPELYNIQVLMETIANRGNLRGKLLRMYYFGGKHLKFTKREVKTHIYGF